MKCSINFTSQYATVAGEYIHVSKHVATDGTPICLNGHELTFVNGSKNIPHFRHKRYCDTGGPPMTRWHSEWQGRFPTTEQRFERISHDQYDARRADIVIPGHNYVVEIQHSVIDKANVICRDHDYQLHGHDVIWIVHGDDVILNQLSDGNYLCTFGAEWKFRSFTQTQEFIMLDIDAKIFKIPVKRVSAGMVVMREYKSVDEVVTKLHDDPAHIWELWKDDDEVLATLTVQQKGAGNGKTYGIWESISRNPDKDIFLIVTKQHTAKEVIYAELEDQSSRECFHIVDNMKDIETELYGRQIIVNYEHNQSGRKCTVVIGTVDSFIYGLTTTVQSSSDYFIGLLDSIIDTGPTKVNKRTGQIRYGGHDLTLSKRTQLWIDETQDLNVKYFQSIVRLMMDTGLDVVAVGDILQSLEHCSNFMTCARSMNMPAIHTIIDDPVNINRRIQVQGMTEIINRVIQFNTYNVPEISYDRTDDMLPLEQMDKPSIEIIHSPKIYAGEAANLDKVSSYINTLINQVDIEVQAHDYSPNDFLFLFVILKNNTVATELDTRLNQYWIDRDTTGEYVQHVVLHKHEEGEIIDTSKSKNATRIMSVRSSKGDGRPVTFVLGCSEEAIKKVSGGEINLVYESHLHVALTRAKKKIYVGLEKNNDDIHRRFGEAMLTAYKPNVNPNMRISRILSQIDTSEIIRLMKDHGVSEPEEPPIDASMSSTHEIVDMGYHYIRRAIYIQYVMAAVIKRSNGTTDWNKSQIKIVLDKLSKLDIHSFTPANFFKYLNTRNSETNLELEVFPLCNLSHKPLYKTYCEKIRQIMDKNKQEYINDSLSLYTQSPLEATIQHYAIDIFKNKSYHSTSPIEIYNIIDYFENDKGTKETELLNEATCIKTIVDNAMTHMMEHSTSTITWNIEHMTKYNGVSDDISIIYTTPIVGHNDTTVYHLMIQTDFNTLNYWETMIQMILERFIIRDPLNNNRDVNNETRFKNKNIKTYVFSLKQNEYKLFDWEWDDSMNLKLKTECKKAFMQEFSLFSHQLFNWFLYVREEQKDEWVGKYSSPMEYVCATENQLKRERKVHLPDIVVKFFDELAQKYKDKGARDDIKLMIKDEPAFCAAFMSRISHMCDTFFGLNIVIDDDDW